jgi:hypothetical protein
MKMNSSFSGCPEGTRLDATNRLPAGQPRNEFLNRHGNPEL